MASTYSTNLALELIGTGEQSGTWGTTTNTNLGTLLEQAISGYVTQAITDGSGANTTITIPNGTTGVARNMFIEMTGALSFSTTSLIVPANKKMYFIFNNTSGGFAVTVKVSGQTGILVPNGKKVVLTCNGTDIVEAHTAIVGNATMGGTLGVTGATTLSSTLGVTGLITSTGGITGGASSHTTGTFSSTLGVTGVSTLTAGAVIQGLTVGLGAGAVATNTAVGASALAANTTGNNNTAVGQTALTTNTSGNFNTAVGRQALFANLIGTDNSGFGLNALVSNTSGSYNTGLGRDALQANTTASNNTAVGYQAGYTLSAVANQTFVGYQAGYSRSTGADNYSTVMVGNLAGYSTATGIDNTYVGGYAARYQTGSTNTALGGGAFYGASGTSTGSNNTAIGYTALFSNTTASNNTAVGYQAGYTNSTGTQLAFFGKSAGAANTTASYNTFIGYQAGDSNTTGAENTAVGNEALGANTTGAGSTSVGSGSLFANTTGTYNSAVGNAALASNTTGSQNVAMGYQAGYSNTTGTDSVYIGNRAGYSNTSSNNVIVGSYAGYYSTGSYNTFIGGSSGSGYYMTTGSKNTIIGNYNGNQGSLDIRTASNYIVLSDGDGNPRGIFDGSGSFFVGTTSTPASSGAGSAFVSDGENRWKLIQNHNTTDPRALQSFYNPNGAIGSIQTSGSATSFNTSSDYRLKNTIAPMTGALAKVALLKPCTYKWNCDGSDGQGFIAHELAEVVPQCVTGEKDAVNEDGSIKSQGIDTSFLVATLTAAIQELKAEFDAYKASHP